MPLGCSERKKHQGAQVAAELRQRNQQAVGADVGVVVAGPGAHVCDEALSWWRQGGTGSGPGRWGLGSKGGGEGRQGGLVLHS